VPTLKPLLKHFKTDRQPRESFGDYCHRLGVEQLQRLLPTDSTSHGAANGNNGQQKGALPAQPNNVETNGILSPRAAQPAAPLTAPSLDKAESTGLSKETILAGAAGEERPDYTFHFNNDGSIRETVIYFYGDDHRAASAQPGDPLRREAIYIGRVDPYRLHGARKLSDTHLVGPIGHERRDYRLQYLLDGHVSQTIIFYYEDGLRAVEAPLGAPIRRQIEREGNAS